MNNIIFFPIYYYTPYNIAGALDLYTVSAFFQYTVVIICILKYKISNHEQKYLTGKEKQNFRGLKLFIRDLLTIFIYIFGGWYVYVAKKIFNKEIKISKKYLFVDSKMPEVKRKEILSYFLMAIVLIFLLISYFVFGFQKFIQNPDLSNPGDAQIIITTFTYLFLFFIAMIIYFVGKKKGWHKRGEFYHGEISELEFAKHNDINDIEISNS